MERHVLRQRRRHLVFSEDEKAHPPRRATEVLHRRRDTCRWRRVANCAEVSQDGLDDTVAKCLTAAVRTWTFPKPRDGGVTVITYPLLFKTGR
jgi:hypothetical protein